MKRLLLALCALLCGLPVHSAVTQASSSGYLVTFKAAIKAPPAKVFAALPQVAAWWHPDHTYAGNSAGLSIEMRAGGCFCERWEGNSIEHARVLYVAREKALRLEGSLGPLQEMAVNGVMNFAMAPAGEDTALTFTYRVRGSADAGLDKTSATVDKVLGEQVQRLVRFVETGSPVPLPPPKPLEDQFFSSDGVRLRFVDEAKGVDPVILLHDQGTSIEPQWVETGIMRELVRQDIFRVVALDLRGHGRSDKAAEALGPENARDVLRLMDHLGISRAHVVGYGLGANIAAYLAAVHPERLVTITLAGGAHARGGPFAVTDEQMTRTPVPALGLIGSRDPAVGDLLSLRRVMPRLVRMISLDGETHASAPRNPEFVGAILYFLRYHPARLVQ